MLRYWSYSGLEQSLAVSALPSMLDIANSGDGSVPYLALPTALSTGRTHRLLRKGKSSMLWRRRTGRDRMRYGTALNLGVNDCVLPAQNRVETHSDMIYRDVALHNFSRCS
jgi:hypothetical protein